MVTTCCLTRTKLDLLLRLFDAAVEVDAAVNVDVGFDVGDNFGVSFCMRILVAYPSP